MMFLKETVGGVSTGQCSNLREFTKDKNMVYILEKHLKKYNNNNSQAKFKIKKVRRNNCDFFNIQVCDNQGFPFVNAFKVQQFKVINQEETEIDLKLAKDFNDERTIVKILADEIDVKDNNLNFQNDRLKIEIYTNVKRYDKNVK